MAGLRRRQKLLDGVLLGLALQLGGELNVQNLVQVALTRFVELVGATRAALVFVDQNGVPFDAVTHGIQWPAKGEPLPVSVGMVQQVFRSGEIIIVGDAEANPEWSSRQSVERLGLKLMVGVPIVEHGRVTAVLYGDATCRAASGFGPRLDLMNAMGRLVSTALTNARLYDQQQRDIEILSEVVRELRKPLRAVLSDIEQVSEEVLKTLDLEAVGTDIESAAENLAHTVDTALELAHLGARGIETPAPVGLTAILEQAGDHWVAVFRRNGIQLVVHTNQDIWVVSQPRGLEVLFIRVLSLLVSSQPSTGTLTASVNGVNGGGEVVFSVGDTCKVGGVALGIASRLGCSIRVQDGFLRVFVPKDARLESPADTHRWMLAAN